MISFCWEACRALGFVQRDAAALAGSPGGGSSPRPAAAGRRFRAAAAAAACPVHAPLHLPWLISPVLVPPLLPAAVAMAGKECVAIGSDLRFGVQLQVRPLACLGGWGTR